VLTRSLRDACEIGAATVKSSSEPSHFLTHPLSHLHRQHAQSLVRSAATKKLKGPGTLAFPAHAISIKNKHLLLSPFGDTNPRFHGGCFGV
jgi:hypothetical protein